MTSARTRDHGGGLDAAIVRFGGQRGGWLDLSTGINPVPYPIGDVPVDNWAALPDQAAQSRLESAARMFWNIPDQVAVLAAPGASSLIARIPALANPGNVRIDSPTYNEHAAAFRADGWTVVHNHYDARVVVHPNNPNGAFWKDPSDPVPLLVIDESFCDVAPARSLVARATQPGALILKSFGKFWGLAGLRLGFAIGDPQMVARLAEMLGPWPVSGPALDIGAKALQDFTWADQARNRLRSDTARLDALMTAAGVTLTGGTTLFRLYRVDDAAAWQARLAEHHVWSRVFPYSTTWLRLGLPHPNRWRQLETAIRHTGGTAGGATSPKAASADPSTQ